MTDRSDDDAPPWVTLLGRDNKLRETLVTAMTALGVYRQAKAWTESIVSKHSYVLSVPDTDPVYYELEQWVLDRLPSYERRSLEVRTQRIRRMPNGSVFLDDDEDEPGPRTERNVYLRYDGGRSQTVRIENHPILVTVEDPEIRFDDSRGAGSRKLGKPGAIQLRCRTLDGREAALRMIQSLASSIAERESVTNDVFISTRYGDWRSAGEIVPRPLESVVLAAGQREELVTDIERFLTQEIDYTRLGIPWHRGYLLHGPPGTGKTSIAQALAGHFNIDVYYVPLSDLEADTDLVQLLSRVQARSLLLLEDVDVAHATRERDDTEKGVSLSGLLNALDGVITPNGLITVMTTNNIDVLDEALIRPGRADRIVPIGYAESEQIDRLLHELLKVDVLGGPRITVEHRVTPAEIVEAIKPFIGESDPTPAIAAVLTLLKNRVESHERTDP